MVWWLKHDKDNGWYKSCQTEALILILKFITLSIGMLENDIYDLTIAAMIYSVLMFDLPEMKSTTKKYKLLCCSA